MPRPKAERIERWTCGACGVACERPTARGQRPKWCDDCRAEGHGAHNCIICGESGVKRGCLACSRICGVYLRTGHWPMSEVPASHPSRSTPVPADHVSRQPGWAAAWPVWHGNCDDCGGPFVANQPAALYCGPRCAKRSGKRRRRAREYGEGDSFRWTEVVRIFLAFGKRCAYCSQSIDGQPDPDHVVPLSRGGHNTISNILPACRLCNADKNDHTLEEWVADRVRRGKPPVVTTWAADDPRYTHLALRPAQPRRITAA